ncbi:hypothetical protein DRE_04919 [Drechslerella stenobrocha 248]|uniref:DNA-binding protein REB1 n=1 Tax=Drechslerella stenobrocha 248 TaxID=1043628 RepID=W7I0A5_9PEZI|nr:hypothetical protein DRE_04919 [Drechslerella stenobrocha 248]
MLALGKVWGYIGGSQSIIEPVPYTEIQSPQSVSGPPVTSSPPTPPHRPSEPQPRSPTAGAMAGSARKAGQSDNRQEVRKHQKKPSEQKSPTANDTLPRIQVVGVQCPIEGGDGGVHGVNGDIGRKRKRGEESERSAKKRKGEHHDEEAAVLNNLISPTGNATGEDAERGRRKGSPPDEVVEREEAYRTPRSAQKTNKRKTYKDRPRTPRNQELSGETSPPPEEEAARLPDLSSERGRRRTTKAKGKDKGLPVSSKDAPAQEATENTRPAITPKARGRRPREVAPPLGGYHKGPYTTSENETIATVVQRYCAVQDPRLSRADFAREIWKADWHTTNFWDILTAELPNRQRGSLYEHVKRSYNNFSRGVWTAGEDQKLAQLVQQKGTKWAVIGPAMERMPKDCKDRWKNYVICGGSQQKSVWNADEKEQLAKVMDEMLTTIVAKAEQEGSTWLAPPDTGDAEARAKWLENEKVHHREELDWGVVSEKMGHTRSRLQCLVKAKRMWDNSAPIKERTRKPVEGGDIAARNTAKKGTKSAKKKKPELQEGEERTPQKLDAASKMKIGDFFFIMQQISILGYSDLASIDWHKITDADRVKHFTAEQLRVGFERYVADKDCAQMDLRVFTKQQLNDMKDLPVAIRSARYQPAVANGEPSTPQQAQQGLSVNVVSPPTPKPSDSRSMAKKPSTPTHLRSPAEPTSRPEARVRSTKKKKSEGESAGKELSGGEGKKSPTKKFKSAEIIEDSDEAAEYEDYVIEEGGGWGVDDSAREADDEMGESATIGRVARKGPHRR